METCDFTLLQALLSPKATLVARVLATKCKLAVYGARRELERPRFCSLKFAGENHGVAPKAVLFCG